MCRRRQNSSHGGLIVTGKKKSIAAIFITFGCMTIGFVLYNWYYTRYLWPADIQRSVTGVELALPSALSNYDGFSAYGQGAHQWRYDTVENPRLRQMCSPTPVSRCRFSKTRRLSSDVEQTVSFKAGVLIVEEVWS